MRRRRGSGAALLAALALTLTACGDDAAEDPGTGPAPGTDTAAEHPTPLVVRVDGASVDLAGAGTTAPLLADALVAFGEPTAVRPVEELACHVDWDGLGVEAIFAHLGGGDACDPQTGRMQRATISSPAWSTPPGLSPGDDVGTLERLYPGAAGAGARRTLETTFSPASGAEEPVLEAVLSDGTVAALEAYVGAAGD